MAQARREVARNPKTKHVEPKECYIIDRGNGAWSSIGPTGCAHWVAHQKKIQNGELWNRCLAGYSFKVFDIPEGRTLIRDVGKVQPGDIWINNAKNHTGLVQTVTAGSKPTDKPKIIIRHDSSGQDKVADNDWATHFHGQGHFYR